MPDNKYVKVSYFILCENKTVAELVKAYLEMLEYKHNIENSSLKIFGYFDMSDFDN